MKATPHTTQTWQQLVEMGGILEETIQRYRIKFKSHSGFVQRFDGPAVVIFRKEDGRLLTEKWCVGGRLHRTGAPAVIKWLVNGGLEEHWFCGGVEYEPTAHELLGWKMQNRK